MVNVTFDQPAYNLEEGDSATVTLTVAGTELDREVEVILTVDPSSPADYVIRPENFTFNSSNTSRELVITAWPDNVIDEMEMEAFTLSLMSSSAQLAATSTATLTITDTSEPHNMAAGGGHVCLSLLFLQLSIRL